MLHLPMNSHGETAQDRTEKLSELARRLFDGRRLIIASNRGPVQYDLNPDDSLTERRGSGGMVTALMAMARLLPLTWVAMAMTEGDRKAAAQVNGDVVKGGDDDVVVRLVTVPSPVYQRHYYVFCNPLLWFIQHFMWNTPRTPNIGRAVYEAWESGYTPVNQALADAVVAEAAKTEAAPVVMLQDYHLYLAPEMIRRARPDAVMLHFTHIPWPGPRYWGLLPKFMRHAIHEAMCANDIVGMQTREDVQNFLHCAGNMLDGAKVDYHGCDIQYRGRTIRVRRYPISIDSAGLIEFARSEEVLRHAERLRGIAGEKTVVRVDRSEPSKNIVRGLRAWELVLERYPEFRGKVNLLQFLVPSRSELGVYQTYTDEIFELVESINDHYGDVGWQPVRVLYEDDYAQAVAGMTLYDVLMVNPLIDGMNLVSKEGPAVNQKDGVVILSEMAGSHEQLEPHALSVSPTDLEGTVRALRQALMMPPDQRKQRAEAMRAVVEREDIPHWLRLQFEDLLAVSAK
jgi:trehalose 6-phosphate synthase